MLKYFSAVKEGDQKDHLTKGAKTIKREPRKC